MSSTSFSFAAGSNRSEPSRSPVSQIGPTTVTSSVAGKFDLVAMVRVQRNEDLAELVTERMVALPGISHTETLIAFRAYSRQDIESGFSLGA